MCYLLSKWAKEVEGSYNYHCRWHILLTCEKKPLRKIKMFGEFASQEADMEATNTLRKHNFEIALSSLNDNYVAQATTWLQKL